MEQQNGNEINVEKKICVKNQFFIALLATTPNMFFGILAGWLSPAIPQLQSPDGPSSVPLSDFEISALGASVTFAAMGGVVIYAWIIDRFGRKIALLTLSIPFAIVWMMKLCSSEFYVLLAARFIAGIPSGGNLIVIPLYIKEISHSSCRGILGTMLIIVLNIGYIISYALGGYSDYHVNMWIFLSLPLLHMIFFFFFGLETPPFLIKRGRNEEAAKTIAWLYGLETTDKLVVSEIEEIKIEGEKSASDTKITFRYLVGNPMTLETLKLGMALLIVHSFCGAFAVMSYASVIYNQAETELDPNAQALVTGCTQLSGCLVTFVLIEKMGRKILLTFACSLAVLSYVLLAVWFLLLDLDVKLPGWIPLMAASFCVFSYGVGTNPLPYVIISEIFDFKTRATLSAYLFVFCWFNDSIVLLGFPALSNSLGMGAVFLIFAFVNLFGILLAIFRLPETKGKNVETIQMEVLDRKKCRLLSCCR